MNKSDGWAIGSGPSVMVVDKGKDPEAIAGGKAADDVAAFIRGRVAELKEELLAEAPYFVLPAGAQTTSRRCTSAVYECAC
jgi:hypothetical protein